MKNAWIYDIYLVGGIPTPVNKNEFVTWDDYIPIYMEKIKKKKSFKPSTSYKYVQYAMIHWNVM